MTESATVAFDYNGTVKFYNMAKGFGFVQLDSGGQVYFTKSMCSRNVTMRVGDRVRLAMEPRDQIHRRATRVVYE